MKQNISVKTSHTLSETQNTFSNNRVIYVKEQHFAYFFTSITQVLEIHVKYSQVTDFTWE